ncbi:FecCD family ABC transporter permease [Longirhabdus pacifica]|uniref:FecCD family ABC transporter permease n=1 Tax=Longirhabdus pacifica TaxID=2305227 RepID=UPI0010089505|nr:iron ABC transporter permease [Longirhabdus pacifica]
MKVLFNTATKRSFGLVMLLVFLSLLFIMSMKLGVHHTTWKNIISTFTQFNNSNEHIIIRDVRFPRSLIAIAVGASLGIAGALLQVLTRNPLADTGILGINGGASLFVVMATTLFSVSSLTQYTWIAFLGAAVFGSIVYVLGQTTKSEHSPIRLTLAGAAIAAFTMSLTNAFLVIDESGLQEVLLWVSGSIAGREMDMLLNILPYMVIGWVGSILIATKMDALMLGENIAKSLGQNTIWVKATMGVLVILLAGSAVAIAGPVAFVGLVIPHIAKYMVGLHSRWIILYSGVLGGCLLLISDLFSRLIAMPRELPIGATTALIGVPVFVYIARKGKYTS